MCNTIIIYIYVAEIVVLCYSKFSIALWNSVSRSVFEPNGKCSRLTGCCIPCGTHYTCCRSSVMLFKVVKRSAWVIAFLP